METTAGCRGGGRRHPAGVLAVARRRSRRVRARRATASGAPARRVLIEAISRAALARARDAPGPRDRGRRRCGASRGSSTGARVTFVANPTDDEVRLRVTPAEVGALQRVGPRARDGGSRWHGRIRRDGPGPSTSPSPPFGSLFVLAGRGAGAIGTRSRACRWTGEWRVRVPGGETDSTCPRPGAVDRARRSSAASRARRCIDARVRRSHASDRDASRDARARRGARHRPRASSTGWTAASCGRAPFRLDVTSAVRAGDNHLEVHVATPWRNRLIAEAAHPTGEIFAPMTAVFEPTAAPLPAGLSGPVVPASAPADGRRLGRISRLYCRT